MSTELIWTAFADEMEKCAWKGKALAALGALGAGAAAGTAGEPAFRSLFQSDESAREGVGGKGLYEGNPLLQRLGGGDVSAKAKEALRIARGAPRTPDVGSIPRTKDIITEPRAVTPEGVQTPWPEWMTR